MTNAPANPESLHVSVWRGDAQGGDWAEYDVPARQNQTVLDVVTWIQRNLEPQLSYRFACRVGVCGSCAMMVNGKPRWTCRSHVKDVQGDGQLTIAPLRNLPVVRDLVTDMEPFFDKWKSAHGQFVPGADRSQPVAPISPASPARQAADAAVECINCAVCYAACDVVQWKPSYLGPAALNRAWTLVNDERDQGGDARIDAVSGDAGCHNCHSQQNCTRFCPNQLDPAASIAGLKKASLVSLLRAKR